MVHCDSIDASGALKQTLINSGLNTYSRLAFAIGSPQKPPTDDEFNAFCTALNGGADMTISETALHKRMHFESLTIVIANLKAKATVDPSTDVIRKIPAAEKQSRFNKHTPKVSLVSLDLTLSRSQQLVIDMMYSLRPHSLHLGLPCGTSSRAREKALPKHLQGRFQAPPPLRDAQNLMGFPHLTGALRAMEAANELYRFAIRLLRVAMELGIVVSIENPSQSWLWGYACQTSLGDSG